MFYPKLQTYLDERIREYSQIPDGRKLELAQVAAYLAQNAKKNRPSKLTFICTHNSRRSHLSQIWAKVAADYYGLKGIETYSGGTEATAFNPRAVAALKRCGLNITSANLESSNPIYDVKHADNLPAQVCFSKVFHEKPNPQSGYCAVMTCSQADDACPLVMGCDLRMPIRYEDPKIADDTNQESARYDERSQQICREMLYMMSQAT